VQELERTADWLKNYWGYIVRKKTIEKRTREVFDDIHGLGDMLASRETATWENVAVDLLVPNRFNPRQDHSPETLEELVGSMREHGFVGALDGRRIQDGRIELGYGARRLLAARMAGVQAIPVFVHEWDDHQMRRIALAENLFREDLTPLELADSVGELYELEGLNERDFAKRLGKHRSWVQDQLALSRAPQDVRQMVLQRPDTVRAARVISRLDDAETRVALRERILAEELTTRQVHRIARSIEEGRSLREALEEMSATPPAKEIAEGPPAPTPVLDSRESKKPGPLPTGPEPAESVPPLAIAEIAEGPPAPTSVLDSRESKGAEPVPPPAAEEMVEPRATPAPDVSAPAVSEVDIPSPTLAEMQSEEFAPAEAAKLSEMRRLVLAIATLNRFDVDAVTADEIEEMLDLLAQIAGRAKTLEELLRTRATPAQQT
jgi:ParB/RepB/Spo0J family partition protein